MAGGLSLVEYDLILVAGLSVVVAAIAWRNRPRRGSYTLAALMVVVAVWEVAHLLAHVTPATGFFRRLRWLGIGSVAFVWFVFVLAYVGRGDLLTRRTLALAAAWPAALNALIWLPPAAAVAGVDPGWSVWTGLYEETSALFWTHIALSYGLFAAGSALLLGFVRRTHAAFRRQGLAVLAGIAALWLGSALTVFELFGDVHVHFLPAGLTAMGLAFLWATTREQLTDLTPVATAEILEAMDVGVVVTDHRGQVVDANPEARSLLGAASPLVGEPVDDRLRAVDPTDGGPAATDVVELRDRLVRVSASTLPGGGAAGSLYVMNDVTEQRRRRTELERQNDRLDQFAGIISHDLRNPLNVATGRLELLRETGDDAHLERVDEALERIESIVDETLVLAREGATVDPEQVEPVSVAEAAHLSWGAVETDEASLEVEADVRVEADRGRLRHVFENLFRNAVQHAEGSPGVRVGPLEPGRGFYVEDDGPGVPDESRGAVFEPGFSTVDAGTGLGLNIVAEIAEGHGWEVDLAEGAEGGARFEFRDVTVVDA